MQFKHSYHIIIEFDSEEEKEEYLTILDILGRSGGKRYEVIKDAVMKLYKTELDNE